MHTDANGALAGRLDGNRALSDAEREDMFWRHLRWVRRNIAPSDPRLVHLEQLAEAARERGFEPRHYEPILDVPGDPGREDGRRF